MIAPMIGTWFIVAIVIFVVLAVGTGGVQLWAAFMDRRLGREVENDTDRPQPHGPGGLHESDEPRPPRGSDGG